MIKIMVVDDEELIMDKLIYLLQNSAIEFEAIKGAGNGQAALSLIEGGYIPDIILSDVRMPVMSGLELIKAVRSTYPDIRFIVVSGYAEFEYAVKAMQYGVTNYVLKPVKAHELISVVESMRDEIKRAKQEKEAKKQTETLKIEKKRMVVEKLLYNLLTNRQNDSGLRRSLIAESEILNHNSYIISAVKLHLDQHPLEYEVFADLQQDFNNEADCSWIMENFFGKYTCILIFAGKDAEALTKSAIKKTRMIHTLLSEKYHLSVTIGISNANSDIRVAYHNGAAALKSRFLYGRGQIFIYSNHVAHKDIAPQSFLYKVKLAEQSLENKSMQKVKSILLQFAEDLFVHHIANYLTKTSIDYLFNEYINIIIRFCLKNNVAFLDKIDPDYLTGKALESLDDNKAILIIIESMIEGIFNDCMDGDDEKRGNLAFHVTVVDNIIHYINRNINEEVTLRTISEKFAINPSYLSRVFKAATEQGFVKYVTGLKIEKAKELLQDSSTEIIDIAHGLGFTDQQYFNRVFKKTTGMTPNELRVSSKKSPKET